MALAGKSVASVRRDGALDPHTVLQRTHHSTPTSLPSDGLAARPSATQDAVSISVAPAFDLDAEVGDLRVAVGKLKSMSTAIGEEAAANADLAESLAAALDQARAACKAGAKRLDRAFKRGKSKHMWVLMLFIVAVFCVLYVAAKLRGLARWVGLGR